MHRQRWTSETPRRRAKEVGRSARSQGGDSWVPLGSVKVCAPSILPFSVCVCFQYSLLARFSLLHCKHSSITRALLCSNSKRFDKMNRIARRHTYKFVKSQFFYWLVIIIVFLNTAVLTSEHFKQDHWLDDLQRVTTSVIWIHCCWEQRSLLL